MPSSESLLAPGSRDDNCINSKLKRFKTCNAGLNICKQSTSTCLALACHSHKPLSLAVLETSIGVMSCWREGVFCCSRWGGWSHAMQHRAWGAMRHLPKQHILLKLKMVGQKQVATAIFHMKKQLVVPTTTTNIVQWSYNHIIGCKPWAFWVHWAAVTLGQEASLHRA